MTLIVALLALAFAQDAPKTVVAGQTTITLPDTTAWSAAAKDILQIEIQRSEAIARHDTTWLRQLYASDFSGVAAGGQLVDQASLMQVFARDAPDTRFSIDELVIRDFGDTATVMGRLRSATAAGASIGASRYLHVYVKRGGRWVIVSAAGSVVIEK